MKRFVSFALLSLTQVPAFAEQSSANPLNALIGEIRQLENKREPKCYATASRLEDFMYGTRLSEDARFTKIALQKALILELWREASALAAQQGAKNVSKEFMEPLLQQRLPYRKLENGDWDVILPEQQHLTVNHTDKRQYSTVAYALRAILAVQQDALLKPDMQLLPLDKEAVQSLQEFLDIATLSVLKIADDAARLASQREIGAEALSKTWAAVMKPRAPYLAEKLRPPFKSDFKTLHGIVAQKIESYEAYNHISAQVFLRNLQVYFAKNRWPADAETGKAFKNLFTEAMVDYANGLMLGAEKTAIANGHALIRVGDVQHYIDSYTPHRINEYEDAIFFPNVPAEQRIVIESYDMDAFRDSGIHWRYLQWAIEDPHYAGALEPDPFAAELLVENIAQYGVLLLRVTGMVAEQEQAERLHPDQIAKAWRQIQDKIAANNAIKPEPAAEQRLASSRQSVGRLRNDTFFTDVTAASGLKFMHRSSDWLSRMIRSVVMKSKEVGELGIPPAFGGSGVAAEDIDGDGYMDLLLLSGLGNKLYINDRHGGFIDITAQAGLDWRRPDGTAGEPRQPIIADFDNDGLRDIFITYVDDAHRLYRNLGNRRFQDVTEQAGLGGKNLVGGPAVAFDYDNDGLLDIYIAYFGDYIHGVSPTLLRRNFNGLPDKLFRNSGAFRFRDVTAGSGVDNTGWGQAAAHTDFDRDGWQDIITGNDFGVNAYYRNKGDGSFENLADALATGKPSYTMGFGIGDLNHDLYPDFYVSNIVTMNKDETYVLPNSATAMKFNPEKLANMRVVEANDLFLSRTENGTLKNYELSSVVERGYSSTGWSWGADFFDADNDGDDDLYVVNGMNDYNVYTTENPYYTDPLENKKRNIVLPVNRKESNVFFINEGGKLQNLSAQSGADLLGNSRSVAYLDYDNDGDLDMVVNNYHDAAVFYRNNAERLKGNWLSIELVGAPEKSSNRDAVGAVIVAATADGNSVWREIHGGGGYLTMHPKRQYFGLGKNRQADISIRWPNGETLSFKRLAANYRYTVTQSDGAISMAK